MRRLGRGTEGGGEAAVVSSQDASAAANFWQGTRTCASTKFFNTVSGSLHTFAACSSDLSRTTSHNLRTRVLATLNTVPSILGSGGPRLITYCTAHAALEARLARTFRSPVVLLFNSGFDANAGFFASVPQRCPAPRQGRSCLGARRRACRRRRSAYAPSLHAQRRGRRERV